MPIKEDTETQLLRALSNTPAAGGLFIPDAGNARFEKYIADASE